MDRFSGYSASFSSAHVQGDSHRGDAGTRLHGHDFQVWVRAKCPWASAIMSDVAAIAEELNGRQLEDMMPASSTDAAGISAWFLERLSMKYPLITEVSVVAAGHNDSAIRESHKMR